MKILGDASHYLGMTITHDCTMRTIMLSQPNYIDNVVTEHGIARLRGTDYSTRAQRLIEVAHPDHREDLYREARELNIISRLSAK